MAARYETEGPYVFASRSDFIQLASVPPEWQLTLSCRNKSIIDHLSNIRIAGSDAMRAMSLLFWDPRWEEDEKRRSKAGFWYAEAEIEYRLAQ